MHKRIDISKLEPTAYEAMLGLEGYIGKTDLSDSMKELIKIRCIHDQSVCLLYSNCIPNRP